MSDSWTTAPAVPSTYSRFNARTGEFEAPRAAAVPPGNGDGGDGGAGVGDGGGDEDEDDDDDDDNDDDAAPSAAAHPPRDPRRRAKEAARAAEAGTIGLACLLAVLLFAAVAFVYRPSAAGGRRGGRYAGSVGGGEGAVGGGSGFFGGGGGADIGDPGSVGSAWREPYHASGRKMQDTRVTLPVTISQLFRGDEVLNVSVQRTERCPACGGAGGSGVGACSACAGRGVEIFNVHVGHGRYQRMQRPCSQCGGEGRVVKHRCAACGGEGFLRKRALLPVVLSAGLMGGDVVRLPEQGDAHAQVGSGDVLVELQERAPADSRRGAGASRAPIARRRLRGAGSGSEGGGGGGGGGDGGARRSDDLEAEVTLSLREALSGFSRTVVHPGDGRDVVVAATAIGAPGAEIVVKGAGMPRRGAAARSRQRVTDDGASVIEMQTPELAAAAKREQPAEFGDLRVRLALALPRSLTEAQQREVDRIFPATPEESAREARAAALRRDASDGGAGSSGGGGGGGSGGGSDGDEGSDSDA